MASDMRPPETHVLYIGESAKAFCADFQDYAPVANGETLSSPSASVTNQTGTSIVTVSSPTVTTADFIEYDRNGNVDDSVPSGKGVKFLVTPGTAKGQATVTVLVVCSGGSIEGKQVYFKVV